MSIRIANVARSTTLLVVAALVLVGCDESGEPAHESRVIPYTHSGVPWVFDDDGHRYLIDTGTPRSLVAPWIAGLADDVFMIETLAGWDVQGLGADAEVVVTMDFPPAILSMIDAGFGGILGADVLARQPFMLDPYRGQFILDDDGNFDEWLHDTEPTVHVPFELVGGGTSCLSADHCFEHNGLRVLVEVEIEGESVVALLDTGSTYTGMGRDLFERLEARALHRRVTISRGWDVWDFARVQNLMIRGVERQAVPVSIDPKLDAALVRLSIETNRHVELILGHSFLLHYATGIDHERTLLTLARYVEDRPIETEMFEGFGVWLSDTVDVHGCFAIWALVEDAPTLDAGLEVGDCVTAINGELVADLTFEDVELYLATAAVGETFDFTVIELGDGSQTPDNDYTSPPYTVSLIKRDFLPR